MPWLARSRSGVHACGTTAGRFVESPAFMNAPMRPEHGHLAGASLSSSLLSFARLLVVVAAPIAGYAYAAPIHPVASPAYGTGRRSGIVVLPFDLTSTSLPLPDLRDAIQDLLASRLDAEGAPGVFDPRVEQAVLGKIEGTPERLVVEARLMSVVDGATKALARVEGTADRLPDLTDKLLSTCSPLRRLETRPSWRR